MTRQPKAILTVLAVLVLVLTLSGCGALGAPVPTLEPARTRLPLPTAAPSATAAPTLPPTATTEASPTPAALAGSCVLSPLVAPTMPAETPGYTEADPVTGLHMTGRPQEIDLATYRLDVTGKVNTQGFLIVGGGVRGGRAIGKYAK